MKYRIELAATAKADIRQQARWLRDQASLATAEKWLAGLYEIVATNPGFLFPAAPKGRPSIAGGETPGTTRESITASCSPGGATVRSQRASSMPRSVVALRHHLDRFDPAASLRRHEIAYDETVGISATEASPTTVALAGLRDEEEVRDGP